jgi:4-amino-4-deoxychorismate lyase
MSRLIESIRVFNGQFDRLELHQARFEHAFRSIFKRSPDWSLESFLREEPIPQAGLYKCRVVYDDQYRHVEFKPYGPRQIKTLKLVVDNTLSYEHKWENREALDHAFAQRDACDDILIVKNGLITDSSYANVVFQKGKTWYTPQACLLTGTMRQFLLTTGVIEACVIARTDLKEFDQCKLVNAMLGWDSPAIDVSNIY